MKQTIYGFTAMDNKGSKIDMARYKGKALLIVNTASKCGFTPQYKGLEELHRRYGPEGLVVLGFPCDQFAHQEPGSDAEIAEFCQRNFGVSFPLMSKIEVNGPGTHPIFDFLKRRTKSFFGGSVKWNFTKFLVQRDGSTVKRYSPTTEPATLAKDIEAALRREPSEEGA